MIDEGKEYVFYKLLISQRTISDGLTGNQAREPLLAPIAFAEGKVVDSRDYGFKLDSGIIVAVNAFDLVVPKAVESVKKQG